tara:strand:+ start:585 stop:953 length:369 start_codon:yes stop_codon:yes gene_type:complete
MTTQRSAPFACRQCGFCKEAFRVDGGAVGIESREHASWFCSGGCLQLANLFKSAPGSINTSHRDALINTYQNCFTYISNGEVVHIPKINEKKTRKDIDARMIYLVKGLYENTSDNNHFEKYN